MIPQEDSARQIRSITAPANKTILSETMENTLPTILYVAVKILLFVLTYLRDFMMLPLYFVGFLMSIFSSVHNSKINNLLRKKNGYRNNQTNAKQTKDDHC